MNKFLRKVCGDLLFGLLNKHKVRFYGLCPVEAWGKLKTGEYYYFRSRGSQWSLELSTKPMDELEISANDDFFDNVFWEYRAKDFFVWPMGGHISKLEAVKLFNLAIKDYYKEKK